MAISQPSIGIAQPGPSPAEHKKLQAQEARILEPGEKLHSIFSIISSDNNARRILLGIYRDVPTSPG